MLSTTGRMLGRFSNKAFGLGGGFVLGAISGAVIFPVGNYFWVKAKQDPNKSLVTPIVLSPFYFVLGLVAGGAGGALVGLSVGAIAELKAIGRVGELLSLTYGGKNKGTATLTMEEITESKREVAATIQSIGSLFRFAGDFLIKKSNAMLVEENSTVVIKTVETPSEPPAESNITKLPPLSKPKETSRTGAGRIMFKSMENETYHGLENTIDNDQGKIVPTSFLRTSMLR